MMRAWFFAMIVATLVIGDPVAAQTDRDEVDIVEISKSGDWTIYRTIRGDPECGVISRPERTVNTKDGQIVDVRRGEILLAVTVLPSGRYRQLVSFQGGYPFASDSVVKMTIGSRSFVLFPGTDGPGREWAWPEENGDQELIEALKSGRDAVITGTSSRGTTTKDTFSLLGITSGLAAAESCAANL